MPALARQISPKSNMIAAAVLGASFVAPPLAQAQSAGDLINKMTPEQSASFIGGVVEGLAFARWNKDKPDDTGMKCIYDWKYGESASVNAQRLNEWLERNPDKPIGVLVHTLIKRDCGE